MALNLYKAPAGYTDPLAGRSALFKIALGLGGVDAVDNYRKSAYEEQDRNKAQQKESALALLAQQMAGQGAVPTIPGVMGPLRPAPAMDTMTALSRMAAITGDPTPFINYQIDQNDPLKKIQLTTAQTQLENLKADKVRKEQLASLFGNQALGTSQLEGNPFEGAVVPKNPPKPSDINPTALARMAAQIDPDNYMDDYLKALTEEKSFNLPEGVDLPEGYVPVPDPNSPGGFKAVPISGATPGADVKAEGDLRKEFDGITKEFREVRSAYTRISKSQDNAAGDIALVFNYMKMLDPGSTVREGEFATAQNAAGIPTQIQNLYNKSLTGERLHPTQRLQMKDQAQQLYGGAKGIYDEQKGRYQGLAKQYGFDPERITTEIPDVNTPATATKRYNPSTGKIEAIQ